MPCEFIFYSDWKRVTSENSASLLIVGPVNWLLRACLDVLSGSETWCYTTAFEYKTYLAIDVRYLKKVEEALRQCAEMMQRDIELVEALIGEKEPESYREFRKEYRRFLKLWGEFIAVGAAIEDLLDKEYKLVEIDFSSIGRRVRSKLANKLARINKEIKVNIYRSRYHPDRNKIIFRYKDKELTIGTMSLWSLLKSAEFAATEEKAVENILTAVRRVFPKEDADRIKEAVEKLRLFKKLLDQMAE